MRNLASMDTIQIELTNLCRNTCSNCTRFAGHRAKPYMMTEEQFKQAINSMVDYPKMTGFQGGEPLLHPQFEEFCNYAHEKIPPEKLGLWTTLPAGKEHLREVICRTFKHIFINDHTRPDIYHHPPLVAVEEQFKDDPKVMWVAIDQCWAQESWSASIYPSGAWFCEIAGSMSMLFAEEGKKGWDVEPGWWWRTPKDFGPQMEMFCPRCGFPAEIRRRASVEGVDDISEGNLKRLEGISAKIAKGKFEVYDFANLDNHMAKAKLAAYKETAYRDAISHRYGMFLTINDQHFWTPHLLPKWDKDKGAECTPTKSLNDIYAETWK